MDTREYLDLYRSESREHLRALSAGILRLEKDEDRGPALEACFRAAHTLKGMAAAMGFEDVAQAAHRLEDLLSALRAGERDVDAGQVDQLLVMADALETAALAAAQAGPVTEPAGSVELSAAELLGGEDVRVPEPGEALAVRILLEPTCALKGARALLVRRQVEAVAPVVRTVPPVFGDDFAGDFRVVLEPGADREAVEAAIRSGGEVRAIHWVADEREAGPAAEPARAAAAPEGRHVRVDRRHLDALADGIGELAVLRGRLVQLAADRHGDELEGVADRLGRLSDDLQAAILDARMIPVEEVFQRFPRAVRDTARRGGKDVELMVEGKDIRVDRAILEEIHDPLLHLLRNAVDHGIEAPHLRLAAGKPRHGRLLLRAERERAGVVLHVEDDGAGISRVKVLARARREGLIPADQRSVADEELLRLLARPGFSTVERVTELSGRGVGMDVVLDRVRALGGSISLSTQEGRGTSFTLRLPLSVALAQALRVRVSGEDYLVPLTHVTEVVELTGRIERDGERELLRVREDRIPLVRLGRGNGARPGGSAVVYGGGSLRGALAVDELVGREQVVVKPYEPPRGALSCFAGVTLLGDGRPALVLDPTSVL
ncbi:MAG TPA: chemotaxis protein CheA [Longimicrobiales bacterium]|nr:chemotaxis protein CheA [Longimicrobiales bacterium]